MPARKFLSVRQACERLGWSDKKLRRWIRMGRLRATRIGYHVVLNERDVEKLAKPRAA